MNIPGQLSSTGATMDLPCASSAASLLIREGSEDSSGFKQPNRLLAFAFADMLTSRMEPAGR